MDLRKKEKRIYREIDKLREGDRSDKLFAAEVIGILCNESAAEIISFDEILDIVEEKIRNYKGKKDAGTV